MVDYIIETKNLTKNFGKEIGVDSINMKVEKGKVYGLLGRNGAGKTTTMCMLLNLSNPSSGEIFLFGENYKENPQKIYKKIGSIIETPGFYENLTAEENLKVFSKLRGNYNKENIQYVLELVSLDKEPKKIFKNYSLGMKQRLGIAASLVHNPEILILDEPINGLDPVGIQEIRKLLKRLVDECGLTVLISSHILSEIEYIADVIGVMHEGKLIEELSKDELHEKLDKYVDFEVSNIDLAVKVLENSGFVKDSDFTVKLSSNNDLNIIEKSSIRLFSNLGLRAKINDAFVKSGIEVQKINLNEENLEQFFISLIGENSGVI